MLAKHIEEDLRRLSAEARRDLPIVKDAAERAILKLRADSPDNAALQGNCQDYLRPSVLACNHKDAAKRLVIAALNSIQHFVASGVLSAEDPQNILRVLQIQVRP